MAMSFLSHPDRKLQEQWLRSAKASPISRKVTGSHGAAFSEPTRSMPWRLPNGSYPIPIGVTFEQAAAALLQGMTAHYLSHSAYPIQPGDEVLIHAGAGGTGLLLTQFAKSRGARVLTTVSNEEKAELSYQAGADDVILYTKSDFADEVKRLTQRRGLAAVYDSIGKSTFEQSLTCLKARGTLVLYGSASGDVPHTLTRAELLDRAAEVFQAVVSGTLKLRMERTYSLGEAAQAHRDLESRKTTGKLLLLP